MISGHRAVLALLIGSFLSSATAQGLPPTIVTPADARAHGLDSLNTRLRQEGVPIPSQIGSVVSDQTAAARLGKALFFDMSVGSDGVQACATCHFHAGADDRTKNQIDPGLTRVAGDRNGDVRGFSQAVGAPDVTFEVLGPNQTLVRNDFPFVRDIGDGANVVDVGGVIEPAQGNSNDVTSSQGVKLTDFVRVIAGARVDQGIARFDPVFHAGTQTVRRVEPRNTPTMINAVLNLFNFWDGRANPIFNGVNPFGVQDPKARVFAASGTSIVQETLALDNASLASQAVGPPLSFFEMSFGDGAANARTFREVGRKLLPMQALTVQAVASDDSLLSNLRHPTGVGLTKSYSELVRAAFQPRYWSSNKLIFFPVSGSPQIIDPSGVVDPSRTFTLMEANFSLFFGVAVMMYERTLIADRTPFDRWMEGNGSSVSGFGSHELAGLNVFVGKGSCVNCHGGPEFTNASVHNTEAGKNVIEPMLMGDDHAAVYDNGFYNIGITPTLDDLGRGGGNPFGQPLSSSRQFLFEALDIQNIPFRIIGEPIRELVERNEDVLGALDEATGAFIPVCHDLDGDGKCDTKDDMILRRVAVDGAFKAPGLRNVGLTGPYFHNGSMATLMEVVEFYDRGGNFCRFNRADLDPDIQPIGLTASEKQNLVSFLLALTDSRVAREAAPFDRPALRVPHGSFPDGTDIIIDLPAVGRGGGAALQPFLNADPFGRNQVTGDTDGSGRVACSPGFGQADD